MIRIQVNLNKPAGDQPKTIYPTNFFVDLENGKLELRDLMKEDAEKFCYRLRDEDKENTKIREESSYGQGMDIIVPLDAVKSILTFKH